MLLPAASLLLAMLLSKLLLLAMLLAGSPTARLVAAVLHCWRGSVRAAPVLAACCKSLELVLRHP
jgi:hypothetical protein